MNTINLGMKPELEATARQGLFVCDYPVARASLTPGLPKLQDEQNNLV